MANDTGVAISDGLTRLLAGIEEAQASLRGLAGDALQNTSAQLGAELRQILEALNTIANAVDATSAKFGDTDSQVQVEINKVAAAEHDGSVASALRG